MSSFKTFTTLHIRCDRRMLARFSTSQIYIFQYARSRGPNLLLFILWSIILPCRLKLDVHSPSFSLSLGVILRFHASTLPVLSWSTECERGREGGRQERREGGRGRRERRSKRGEFLLDSVAFSLTREGQPRVCSVLCVGQKKVKDALGLQSPRKTSDYTFLIYNWKKVAVPQEMLKLAAEVPRLHL